jgi:hypothetical protein
MTVVALTHFSYNNKNNKTISTHGVVAFVVKETWLLSSGRPSYTKRRSFHVLQHDSWDAFNFNSAQATFKLFTYVVKEM